MNSATHTLMSTARKRGAFQANPCGCADIVVVLAVASRSRGVSKLT